MPRRGRARMPCTCLRRRLRPRMLTTPRWLLRPPRPHPRRRQHPPPQSPSRPRKRSPLRGRCHRARRRWLRRPTSTPKTSAHPRCSRWRWTPRRCRTAPRPWRHRLSSRRLISSSSIWVRRPSLIAPSTWPSSWTPRASQPARLRCPACRRSRMRTRPRKWAPPPLRRLPRGVPPRTPRPRLCPPTLRSPPWMRMCPSPRALSTCPTCRSWWMTTRSRRRRPPSPRPRWTCQICRSWWRQTSSAPPRRRCLRRWGSRGA